MISAVEATHSINSLVNQVDIAGLPHRIADAIKSAAAKTGVDFSYLLKKAGQESSFDPNAKAVGSSATGLFQFTNQTWLRTVKAHGDEHGLGRYADHILVDKNGVARVSDPVWRQAILDLRKDPQTSALMAGELDKENLTSLQANVGGKIGSTDLYLAHFLGACGASDFLNKLKANPQAKAADILPEAASANPSVFYNSSGEPKSLKQIYNHFAQKFDAAPATIQVASAGDHYAAPIRYQAKATPVKAYSVATAHQVDDNSSAAANYSTSALSTIKANTSSSLMATMILAQMNLGANSTDLSQENASQSEKGKKSAINILASVG